MSQRPPEEPQEPPHEEQLPDDQLPEDQLSEDQLPDESAPEEAQPQEEAAEEAPLEGQSPEEELPEEDDESLEEDEELLSGTLLGSLHQATQGLGGYGAALFGGGIFAVIVGGIVYLLIGDLRLYATIILGIGAALLLLAIVTSLRAVGTILGARRGRYGVNSLVMVTAFLGIIAVASFLLFENAWRFDVTATSQFSLATRTKNLLSELDHEVLATAFFVEDSPEQQAALGFVEDTLREFDARSNNFSYRVVDPDREPEIARNLGVFQYGTIALQCIAPQERCLIPETNRPRVHLVSPSTFLEQDFVTALLIITEQQQKKVYFLTGHQERSIGDTNADSDGYGIAASLGLRGENYFVDEFNLLGSDPNVPDDATLVVIPGPKRDFFALGDDSEIKALDEYLVGGGRLLVLLDPEDVNPGDEGMKDFREFLARWGIQVLPGHIVDEQSRDETGRSPVVLRDRLQYGWEHRGVFPQEAFAQFYGLAGPHMALMATSLASVTGGLDATYYPGLVALRPSENTFAFPPEGLPPEDPQALVELKEFSAVALALTSPASTRIEELDREEPASGDEIGPFLVGLAVRPTVQVLQELQNPNQSEGPFIVAIGDSDFASNTNFYQGSNSDFFLNTVNWLAGDVSLVDIRPKPFQLRRLVLDEDQRDWVRYSSWFLLPAIMLILASIVWWVRR